MSLFLTREEVEALTGYKRYKAQCRALTALGLPHMTRGDGSPVVAHAALERQRKRHQPTQDEIDHAYYEAEYEDHQREDEPWRFAGLTPNEWVCRNWRQFVRPIADVFKRRRPLEEVLTEAHSLTGYAKAYVYFLIDDWEIFYVGKTTSPAWRFDTHAATYSRRLTHISTITVPTMYVEDIEALYIHMLRPPENVKYPAMPWWAERIRVAYELGTILDQDLHITDSPLPRSETRALEARERRHAEVTACEPAPIMPLMRQIL